MYGEGVVQQNASIETTSLVALAPCECYFCRAVQRRSHINARPSRRVLVGVARRMKKAAARLVYGIST
jgi:hypothetical protein